MGGSKDERANPPVSGRERRLERERGKEEKCVNKGIFGWPVTKD